MYQIITDSIYYYQKNKDFLFKNDIYKWTLKTSNNELKLHKKIIDKKIEYNINNEEIIAIISPSNYKLLFDLKELNVRKFYLPEFYAKRTNFKIDYKKIDILFENFLKRSYLSFLNYERLQRIGLNRVEQYIIMLNIVGFSSYKNIDNLILNKSYSVKNIIKIESGTFKTNRLSLLKTIKMLSLKYDISFDESSKFLLQQYGSLNISDPFQEDGFVLLKKIEDEKKELNNIFLKILKNEIEVEKYRVIMEDDKGLKKEIIVNKMKDYDEDISNYYNLQKDDYFIGKHIRAINAIDNIEFIYNNLKDILPLKDYVLTLKSLIKLSQIVSFKNCLSIEKENVAKLKVKSNYEWISQKVWKNIYNLKTFSFNNILDEIKTDEVSYECPCCGFTTYHISPMKFYCKNRTCRFIFDRLTLKIVEVKPILEEKMKEALIHKKVFVRNKNGKNFIAYLRNKDKYYYLSLK